MANQNPQNFGFLTADIIRAATDKPDELPKLHRINAEITAIQANDDRAAVTIILANASVRMRRELHGVYREEEQRFAAIIAEVSSSSLPDGVRSAHDYTQAEVTSIWEQVKHRVPAAADANRYQAQQPYHAVQAEFTALEGGNGTTGNLVDVVTLLVQSDGRLKTSATSGLAEVVVNLCICLSKRGSGSNAYVRRRTPRYAEEMNCPNLNIDPASLRYLWTRFLSRITVADIGPIFTFLNGAIPAPAVTLRETMRQAQYAGYSWAVFALQAIRLEPRFPWTEFFNEFPAEWAECQLALTVLSLNPYAGWATPLLHPSRGYPHVGYAGLKVLKDAAGHRTLADYGGTPGTLPSQLLVDTWVAQYVQEKAQQLPQYPAAAQRLAAPAIGAFAAIPLL